MEDEFYEVFYYKCVGIRNVNVNCWVCLGFGRGDCFVLDEINIKFLEFSVVWGILFFVRSIKVECLYVRYFFKWVLVNVVVFYWV